MGIALLTFSDLFADWWMPLQNLAGRWLPTHRRAHRCDSSGLRYVAVRPVRNARGLASASGNGVTRASRPLRVVRVIDPQQPDHHGSRVVISGRMADVCAELDRLAAMEAQEPGVWPHTH